MTKEKALTKKIQLFCGENNILCFDVNVGKFALKNGGYFDVGLPAGFPDLLLLTSDGRTVFIEAKIKPNKPQINQVKFINELKKRNFSVYVIYSIEEFIEKFNSNFPVDTIFL